MSEHSRFSVPRHVIFLDGYLDAVGRLLTTDTELWALTARDGAYEVSADRSPVQNWSEEFGSVVENFLGLNQRERLGFYLIDYICWFREFTHDAKCFKLTWAPLSPGSIDRLIYLLQLEGDQLVLILFERIDKARRAASQIE